MEFTDAEYRQRFNKEAEQAHKEAQERPFQKLKRLFRNDFETNDAFTFTEGKNEKGHETFRIGLKEKREGILVEDLRDTVRVGHPNPISFDDALIILAKFYGANKAPDATYPRPRSTQWDDDRQPRPFE